MTTATQALGGSPHRLGKNAPDHGDPMRRFLQTMAETARRYAERRRARRAIRMLRALDDRTLKDIGVARCEIPYVALNSGPIDADRERHICRAILHQ